MSSRDPEPEQPTSLFGRLAAWWTELPMARRVNVALYVLAGLALVFLLTSLLGDDSPGGDVVAGPPTSAASRSSTTSRATTSTTRALFTVAPTLMPSNTASSVAATTTTARPGSSTTTTVPQPISTMPMGGGTTSSTSSTAPISTSSTTAPPSSTTSSTAPTATTTTTSTTVPTNQPVLVSVDFSPAQPAVGQDVTFTVTVSDADHLVTENCAIINFGDGSPVITKECVTPPCPGTPPAPLPAPGDTKTFPYTHKYASLGAFTATFEYHTKATCTDAYGGDGTGSRTVTLTTTTSSTVIP